MLSAIFVGMGFYFGYKFKKHEPKIKEKYNSVKEKVIFWK